MYKAAILLNVSGFPKHGEIKCLVLVPGFCPANGGNGIIGAKPIGSILSVCYFTGDPQAIVSLSG